jgi:glycosyltransferase involved in cell wall biosynthesis
MGMGTIPILNLGTVGQGYGHIEIPPRKWHDVETSLATRLAGEIDYRCDSNELLDTYAFERDGLIHLGWSSPLWYPDGYGNVAQEIANQLLQMPGVKATIVPRDYHPGKPECGGLPIDRWGEAFMPQSIIEALSGEQAKCLYGINMTFPGDCHRSVFPRTIAYTMFETTATPLPWTAPMNLCRRILTPCQTSADSFRARGVTVPIHVVPLGVNPENWPVVDRSGRDGPFTFLMAGGLTHRKNPTTAVRAFLCAFPNGEDVRLVLKTRAGERGGFVDWVRTIPRDDRICVVSTNSTPQEMREYFNAADAFVWPSRGEGFGIPPLEAMATGLPTIVADNSGMSQYCDPRYNYPIPCQEVAVPSERNGGFPKVWGDCGNWWEPDGDAVVEAMREIYANRDKARKRGERAAEWVRDNWTVTHTCQKILEIVCDDARETGLI